MSDFDFLYGEWTIANRRLRHLFVGSDEWEEFPATSWARPLLDGVGNVDEMHCPTQGWSGASIRFQDQESGEWSIYWANSSTGRLFPPVVGRFSEGRGDFFGEDTHEGEPITAHFTWSDITPVSATWQQEFSRDGGETWECNWIMEFTRA
ncbi:hypothetical protein ACFVTX_15920 [Agromyces sp. NPDC058136]|uniref:hypothetical protein n=1 Tax=Agromyces sp. NPDC058136 TaxID=3346354 RepID=UPI0036DAA8B8